jgi:hypothetical protein
MPFDPSGNFSRLYNWTDDRDNGIRILADRHDGEDDNFANAFNVTFLRTGIVPMTGDIAMGSNGIHALRSGTAALPSVTWEQSGATGIYQVNSTALGFSSNGVEKFEVNNTGASVFGTLNATSVNITSGGLTLTGDITAVNAHFSGAVSGASGAFNGPVSATSGAFSSSIILSAGQQVIVSAASGHGGVSIIAGDGTHSGYVAFFDPSNTRHGYIGYGVAGGVITYSNDESGGHAFVGGQLTRDGNRVWDAGNMGSGSGLNADLLDGQDSSYFTAITARLGYTPVHQGGGAGQGTNAVYIGWSGSRVKVQIDGSDMGNLVTDTVLVNGTVPVNGTAMNRNGNVLWGPDNQGPGSGLNADLLDGLDSTAFPRIIASNYGLPGYEVWTTTKKRCWGVASVPGNGGTVVVPLPTPHSSYFVVSLGTQVKNSSGANVNTGLVSKNGLTSFTIINWESTAMEVDWTTDGV